MDNESKKYFEWLCELEATADERKLPASRTYSTAKFSCHTRSSAWCSGLVGHRAICFANINARTPGEGLMTKLLAYIEEHSEQLQATHLYFENVMNPRLGNWLERNGYSAVVVYGELGIVCYAKPLPKAVLTS